MCEKDSQVADVYDYFSACRNDDLFGPAAVEPGSRESAQVTQQCRFVLFTIYALILFKMKTNNNFY